MEEVAWQVLLFHKNQILLRVKLLKAKTESGFHAAIKAMSSTKDDKDEFKRIHLNEGLLQCAPVQINSLSSLEQSPRGYVESCASKGIEYSCFFSLHLLDVTRELL
ncbi:hypothetical protein V6N12_054559 [Hibiscus sabdariffa]|uniref:Uncharacterized protein n=1 Tax=Hibiscus sabdariffa TaxID=183260 RepID=A0ABR2D150_9ROSI